MTEDSVKKKFHFRVYGPLNDFLPVLIRQRMFTIAYKTPITLEEIIESIGIPHSEIALLLANSEPVKFNYKLHENDYISLYPAFETLDVSVINTLADNTFKYPRFILDSHLGKLAKYLRMLGFDTLYENNYEDQHIIELSINENRIILSRDKQLLSSRKAIKGYYVRSIEKHEQLKEIVKRFDLTKKFRSFTRCMTCNTALEPKSKEEIADLIDTDIFKIFYEYYYCSNCRKVFWKGSHFARMEKLIISLAKS